MMQIAISDNVADSLTSAAQQRGCSPEELASFAIENWLGTQELELTPEQDALIRDRLCRRPATAAFISIAAA